MNRKLTLINVGLAAVLGWGGWTLQGQYQAAEERYEIFDETAGMIEPPALPAPGDAPVVRAATYAPISQRLLFSQDRNPVIEVVVPEEVAIVRPPMPSFAGFVDLGDGPLALMAANGSAAKWTAVGEQIGDYKLSAVTGDKVTLEWQGEEIEISQSQLSSERPARGERKTAAKKPPPAGNSREEVADRTAANLVASGVTEKGKFTIGKQLGSGGYAADPNDGAADGTEFKGYVRRVRVTPFGSQHWWDKKE